MTEEMQEYDVILTWEAIYDVTDIADYIEAEFGQNRADCFQNDIKAEMVKSHFHHLLFSIFSWRKSWKSMF